MLACRDLNSKGWETVNKAMHGLQQLLYFNDYRLLDQQERTARMRTSEPAQLAPGSHVERAAARGQSNAASLTYMKHYQRLQIRMTALMQTYMTSAAGSKMQWPPWTRSAGNSGLQCSRCWQAMCVAVLYQHWQRSLA
jgi:hypothetical protein